MGPLFDWGQLLAHLTEMIRAAHPAPLGVPWEPRQQARALVGVLGSPFVHSKAIELHAGMNPIVESFRLGRAGNYRVVMTQMGNVPVVISRITLAGTTLCLGYCIGAEIVVRSEDANKLLELEFEALWWTGQKGIHGS